MGVEAVVVLIVGWISGARDVSGIGWLVGPVQMSDCHKSPVHFSFLFSENLSAVFRSTISLIVAPVNFSACYQIYNAAVGRPGWF